MPKDNTLEWALSGVVILGGLAYWSSTSSPALPQSIHPTGLAWGATVSAEFRAKVMQVGRNLSIDPSYLMTIMRAESGISSHIHIIPIGRNARGGVIYKRSYAIPIEEGTIGGGLIGFMASTARGLGTTLGALLALDGPAQLDYVQEFYRRHQQSGVIGKNPSLWRLYMATFLPAFAKFADNPTYILAAKDSPVASMRKIYAYNSTADRDLDGDIEIQEAMAKIDGILRAGLKKGRVF